MGLVLEPQGRGGMVAQGGDGLAAAQQKGRHGEKGDEDGGTMNGA